MAARAQPLGDNIARDAEFFESSEHIRAHAERQKHAVVL